MCNGIVTRGRKVAKNLDSQMLHLLLNCASCQGLLLYGLKTLVSCFWQTGRTTQSVRKNFEQWNLSGLWIVIRNQISTGDMQAFQLFLCLLLFRWVSPSVLSTSLSLFSVSAATRVDITQQRHLCGVKCLFLCAVFNGTHKWSTPYKLPQWSL